MMMIRNNAALTAPIAVSAAGSVIPFDTIVYNTNGSMNLLNNAVQISAVGIYDTTAEVIVSNTGSSDVTVSLSALANGSAIAGSTATATIPASSTATLILPWATKAIGAASGNAALSWQIAGGACNITNATAKIRRLIW